MTSGEAALLGALAPFAFHALLLFARVGAAAMLLPGLGEAEVPATIRLAVALALTLLLLPVVSPSLPPVPGQPAELLRLILLETLVGLWLGGLARLLVLALAVAGQAVALMLGLASVLVQDPGLGQGGTALSRLSGLAAAVLVLSSGLYALPVAALAGSYAVFPAGDPLPPGLAAESLAAAGTESLALALRLAAPFVLAAVLFNLALGLLARLAPQVQVYFVAVPAQILGGLALLGLVAAPLLALFAAALAEGFARLPGHP
ncbi:MAG: flagellar biosynthetic protein FliR [Acetobacteraceae bacterium]|nr:flagellar biosynthetic protein FliR [Acetobacteraceae bacterium]MDW8397733.1 flagellar biosynthetic protein FliR [Acetobacteraceae bacterium]